MEATRTSPSMAMGGDYQPRRRPSLFTSKSDIEGRPSPPYTTTSPITPDSANTPTRPKPAPVLWTDLSSNNLYGLETAIAPGQAPPQLFVFPQTPSLSYASRQLSISPKTYTVGTRGPQRSRERSLSRRRKEGVVDLTLEPTAKPMTTVQECAMDSRKSRCHRSVVLV